MSLQTEARSASEPTGFRPYFLTTIIDHPTPTAEIAEDLVQLDGSPVINYTHFSLTLSRTRKMAYWVGWNIDGTQMQLLSRSGINFTTDPRIPTEDQAGNDLYADNRLDRSHLARRADLTWGLDTEAQQANKDSFYFTNITPQMEDFNQSAQPGSGDGWKMHSTKTWSSMTCASASSPAPSSTTMTSTTAVTSSRVNTGKSSSLNRPDYSAPGRSNRARTRGVF